jgi:hypothetical protein
MEVRRTTCHFGSLTFSLLKEAKENQNFATRTHIRCAFIGEPFVGAGAYWAKK